MLWLASSEVTKHQATLFKHHQTTTKSNLLWIIQLSFTTFRFMIFLTMTALTALDNETLLFAHRASSIRLRIKIKATNTMPHETPQKTRTARGESGDSFRGYCPLFRSVAHINLRGAWDLHPTKHASMHTSDLFARTTFIQIGSTRAVWIQLQHIVQVTCKNVVYFKLTKRNAFQNIAPYKARYKKLIHYSKLLRQKYTKIILFYKKL